MTTTDSEMRGQRLFLLGAGFSAAAGLPLTSELLPLVKSVVQEYLSVDGFTHLEAAIEDYEEFLAATDPSSEFNLEEFGAWLDWEHALRLRGSDTFSQHGNEPSLQLRWAVGKVLNDRMPAVIPELYLDFARQLTTKDRVLTLNYDLLLERALDAVALPYRRFPCRFSEIHDTFSIVDHDHSEELFLGKLHGSIDWTYFTGRESDRTLELHPLVEGLRPANDPLAQIAVIPRSHLGDYYSTRMSWWSNPPLMMTPSTAKPLATSLLVPMWDGAGLFAHLLAGFTVIGCSLPPADPYVLHLVYDIAVNYAAGLQQEDVPWPRDRMKVIDLRVDPEEVRDLMHRYQFFNGELTDFILSGFTREGLTNLFSPPAP